MGDKLTDLQLRILRALREHKNREANDVLSTGEIFSMDAFYKSLPVEVQKSRLQEDIDILQSDGYIVRRGKAFGEIGTYDITAQGLKYLRNIDG